MSMKSALGSDSEIPIGSAKNSDWITLITVTILVFIVQASWAIIDASGPTLFLDELTYKLNAAAIFDFAKCPSAHYPPVYSLTLAPAFFFSSWYEAMLVINALLCSMIVPASWLLARSVGMRHALLAASLTALLPMQATYPHFLLSENLSVPLFALTTALALRGGSKRGHGAALFFGLILGITHLTKYLFLPAVPLLVGVWLVVHHQERRQSYSGRNLWTIFSHFICIALTYGLTFGGWLFYGRTSGFAWSELWGFGISGVNAESANLASLLVWATAYTSYVALAWCPVWALLAAWIIQLRDKNWRRAVNSRHWRFLTLLAMLLAGYWLIGIQHSFGATYNYPDPQYVIGRYLMHLSPPIIILGVWLLERFVERPATPRLKSGLVCASITCGLAFLSWSILFHQAIWPFPNWFAQLFWNSVHIIALYHPFIFATSMIVSLLPLVLMHFRGITVRWLVLPLAVLLLMSLYSNTMRVRGPRSGIHAREAAMAISKLAKSEDEKIHIVVGHKYLSLRDFEYGLRFWSLSDKQFSAQVVLPDTNPDFKASTLFVTTRTLNAPPLRTYKAERQSTYHIYQMSAHEPTIVRPQILKFGPKTIEAGKPFNVQSSGNSGIWLKIRNTSSRTYLTIDDHRLDLVFGKNGFVSTTIPKMLTATPRTAQLRLHDPDTNLTSKPMALEILPIEIP